MLRLEITTHEQVNPLERQRQRLLFALAELDRLDDVALRLTAFEQHGSPAPALKEVERVALWERQLDA